MLCTIQLVSYVYNTSMAVWNAVQKHFDRKNISVLAGLHSKSARIKINADKTLSDCSWS